MPNEYRAFRDAIYEQFARVGKAVDYPKRIELLDLLSQGERTVEVLAELTKMSVANTSRHLRVLFADRLVEMEKRGVHAWYRLADESVFELLRAVRAVAEARLAEVEQVTRNFLEGREGMESVDRETLRRRAANGEVIVLDVRPREEYRAGHIPGAVSIPLAELEERLAELPSDREIVAYCRGPYCVLSVRAVELLRSRGLKAARLQEGLPDWRALGYPVAVGEDDGCAGPG
jgi:rhodanese-related sulfurtransferase/DNA-binding transcriptional ArsR family regulator